MLSLVLLAVIIAATLFVVMMAPRIGSLLLRAVGLGLVALLWLPATMMWVDAFADPLYRKDYVVGSVLMSWVFMFVAAVSVVVRLIVLLATRGDGLPALAPDAGNAPEAGHRD